MTLARRCLLALALFALFAAPARADKELLLDSASPWQISRLRSVGGVTINPKLEAAEAKQGVSRASQLRSILKAARGPVHIQVDPTLTRSQEMVEQARWIKKLGDSLGRQVIVKIPVTEAGLSAIRTLAQEGVTTNATAVLSVGQAERAALAGASYVSPYLARLEEQTGKPGAGPELVRAIRGSFGALGIKGTRILAASFRTPAQVTAALAAGADLATVPPKVLRQMSSHAGTRGAMRSFRDAWRGAERVRPQVRQRGARR